VAGLASDIYPKTKTGIVRLGGEGRGAAFKCISVQTFEVLKTSKVYDKGIKLILLSALHVPQTENYTPLPNFEKHEHDGETVWIGEINDIKLTLHCAIIGKAVREGGWDLQKRQPKPVRSLLPAGSVFYCTVDDGDIKTKTALTTLHNQQIAEEKSLDKSLGRGLFAVCPWFEHYNFKEHA
jgi:CRISPR-associated protein Cmr3